MRKAPYLTLLFTLSVAAQADDGFLTFGGAPRLLSHHPSIRMARETVVIDVLPQGYRVEATFAFRNDGPACAVRMGFPDRGEGAEGTVFGEDSAEAQDKGKPSPVYSGLNGFASSVDGVRVATVLVPDGEGAQSWHTKTVRFGRSQTRLVRVRYEADGGGVTASGPGYLRELDHVLHTGASWKGPIGYASVLVRFPKTARKEPIRPVSARSLGVRWPYELKDWHRRPAGTVVWKGPGHPRLQDGGLLFVRRGFEPRERDDVALWFGFPHRYRWQEKVDRESE